MCAARIIFLPAAVTAILAAAQCRPGKSSDPLSGRDFDPTEWKARAGEDGTTDGVRASMFADVRRRVEGARMTREEVRSLLGPPEGVDLPELASWHLGFVGGGRQIDTTSLDVHFDAAGHATAVTLLEH